MPQKTKDIWKIVLVAEPTAAIGKIPYKTGFAYGTGAIVFEQLNRIIYGNGRDDRNLLDSSETDFDGIKLLFFKDRYREIPNESRMNPQKLCDEFHKHIMGKFAQGNRGYFTDVSNTALCTGEALTRALQMLHNGNPSQSRSRVKTVLLFISDDVRVFDPPYMGNFEVTEENRPDLSVFYLNDKAVLRAAGVLSQFNTPNGNAGIFSFRSVIDDTAAFCGNTSIEKAVEMSLQKKRGTAYALHGMLMDTLGVKRTLNQYKD